jgi:hypothetical protein
MTTGQPASPPNMYWIFAALLTIWSKASRLKFTVMISTTGRPPAMAEPIAAPTNPSSEIGVSRTRCSPYFSIRPAVTR